MFDFDVRNKATFIVYLKKSRTLCFFHVVEDEPDFTPLNNVLIDSGKLIQIAIYSRLVSTKAINYKKAIGEEG